jgi:plastocyanin
MQRSLLIAFLLISSSAARGDTLSGVLDEPAVRRKTSLVYLENVPGEFKPEPATMNQRGNTYLPHLLPVLQGAKVTFASEDPELHNVYAREGKHTLFNQAVLPKQKFERVLTEVGPVHMTCNVHKEMSAWVLVLQNPFFARPDPKTGAFTLPGVPAGSYTLRIWGEELTDEQNAKGHPVTVGPGSESLHIAAN